MILDWLLYGLLVWAVVALLNKVAFASTTPTKAIVWILTTIAFFANVVGLTMLKLYRFSAVSEQIGTKVTPRDPLDITGAILFTWVFYALIKNPTDAYETTSKAPKRVTGLTLWIVMILSICTLAAVLLGLRISEWNAVVGDGYVYRHPSFAVPLMAFAVLCGVGWWLAAIRSRLFRLSVSALLLLSIPAAYVLAVNEFFDNSSSELFVGWLVFAITSFAYLQNAASVRQLFERPAPQQLHSTSLPALTQPSASFAARSEPNVLETDWAAALAEFESPNRRAGVWAEAFANASGNEATAKAAYLRKRASEIARSRRTQSA